MVFKQKGGPAAKRNFQQVSDKLPKKKVFEEEEDDDDDDDDIDDSDIDMDSDDGSDSGEGPSKTPKGKQPQTPGKGSQMTPKGMAQTPAMASGKKGKMTPKGQAQAVALSSAKKGAMTPKGKDQTSVSSSKKGPFAVSPQTQGKPNAMKAFPGIRKGLPEAKTKRRDAEEEEDDDDDEDDDDEEDDDSEDDDDDDSSDEVAPEALNESAGKKTVNGRTIMQMRFDGPLGIGRAPNVIDPEELRKFQESHSSGGADQPAKSRGKMVPLSAGKPKAAKGVKKEDSEEDSDDDEDLSDEDDDEEDDDSEEDDDDDDDDDEDDDKKAVKKKIIAIKKEMEPSKLKQSQTKPQEAKSKKAKNVPSQPADSKDESSTNKAFQQSVEMDLERKRQRDARNLFIRALPSDVTVEEVKSLSPDILDVKFPKQKFGKKKNKFVYGFLEFANEQKAEENFVKLQKKKIRGQEFFVDYSGTKSKNQAIASANMNSPDKAVNRKKLFVSGLPVDVTMVEMAQLFPQCYSILLNNSPEFRNCHACFHTEEAATEAFKASENARVKGRAITVLYAVEKSPQKNVQKRKRPFEGNKNVNKKFKPEGNFGQQRNFVPERNFGQEKNFKQEKNFGQERNFRQEKTFKQGKNFRQEKTFKQENL